MVLLWCCKNNSIIDIMNGKKSLIFRFYSTLMSIKGVIALVELTTANL